MTRKEIGLLLKSEREAFGINHYKAGIGSGLRPDHVKRIENGVCNWSEESTSKYAALFGYELCLIKKVK